MKGHRWAFRIATTILGCGLAAPAPPTMLGVEIVPSGDQRARDAGPGSQQDGSQQDGTPSDRRDRHTLPPPGTPSSVERQPEPVTPPVR
jgi:hypothetical protein